MLEFVRKNYLPLLYPTFKASDGDAQNYFGAIKSDYEVAEKLNLIIQALVAVQRFELNLLVCHHHKEKLYFYFVHTQRSFFSRVFSPVSDEFAPAVFASDYCLLLEKSSTPSYKMYPLTGS